MVSFSGMLVVRLAVVAQVVLSVGLWQTERWEQVRSLIIDDYLLKSDDFLDFLLKTGGSRTSLTSSRWLAMWRSKPRQAAEPR